MQFREVSVESDTKHDKTIRKKKKLVAATIRKGAKGFSERVAPVYKALDWKWYRPTGYVVPDKNMIYHEILMLADRLEQSGSEEVDGEWNVGTGGLCIGYITSKDEVGKREYTTIHLRMKIEYDMDIEDNYIDLLKINCTD